MTQKEIPEWAMRAAAFLDEEFWIADMIPGDGGYVHADWEASKRDVAKAIAEALGPEMERLTAEIAWSEVHVKRLTRERDEARNALLKIAGSGERGTTGEDHARCIEIARRALGEEE